MSHPAPEVAARDAVADEMPTGAARLVKLAESLGWAVTATYARGTDINRQGKSTKVVDSIVVRLAYGNTGAVSAWLDGSHWTSYHWTRGTAAQHCGARDVVALVKGDS